MSGARGGPEKCSKSCDECEGEEHHWVEEAPDPEDLEDEQLRHEAVTKYGLSCWYACKHCNAWVEDLDEEDDE